MNSSAVSDDISKLNSVRVLLKAMQQDRFPQAVLLHSENEDVLWKVCNHLVNGWLKNNTSVPIQEHPDCFIVRPEKKMRLISVEKIRMLTRELQKTPHKSDKKAGVLWEVDRLHTSATNAFLKTLEEPPADTALFLLTTRPYALLPTLRSRCLSFGLPVKATKLADSEWNQWLSDYREWLVLALGPTNEPSTVLLFMYGLLSRFEKLLEDLSKEVTSESVKEPLPEEEKEAESAGAQVKMRRTLFQDIQQATASYFLEKQKTGEMCAITCSRTIQSLDKNSWLSEVNFNETSALENFLLKLLRLREPLT